VKTWALNVKNPNADYQGFQFIVVKTWALNGEDLGTKAIGFGEDLGTKW